MDDLEARREAAQRLYAAARVASPKTILFDLLSTLARRVEPDDEASIDVDGSGHVGDREATRVAWSLIARDPAVEEALRAGTASISIDEENIVESTLAPDGEPYEDEQPRTWEALAAEFDDLARRGLALANDQGRLGLQVDLYALGRSEGRLEAAARIRYLEPRITAAERDSDRMARTYDAQITESTVDPRCVRCGTWLYQKRETVSPPWLADVTGSPRCVDGKLHACACAIEVIE